MTQFLARNDSVVASGDTVEASRDTVVAVGTQWWQTRLWQNPVYGKTRLWQNHILVKKNHILVKNHIFDISLTHIVVLDVSDISDISGLISGLCHFWTHQWFMPFLDSLEVLLGVPEAET